MSGGITLAPCGLIVERIESGAAALLIVARPAARTAVCPACGTVSAKVHSLAASSAQVHTAMVRT
jgi:hypothetical protein